MYIGRKSHERSESVLSPMNDERIATRSKKKRANEERRTQEAIPRFRPCVALPLLSLLGLRYFGCVCADCLGGLYGVCVGGIAPSLVSTCLFSIRYMADGHHFLFVFVGWLVFVRIVLLLSLSLVGIVSPLTQSRRDPSAFRLPRPILQLFWPGRPTPRAGRPDTVSQSVVLTKRRIPCTIPKGARRLIRPVHCIYYYGKQPTVAFAYTFNNTPALHIAWGAARHTASKTDARGQPRMRLHSFPPERSRPNARFLKTHPNTQTRFLDRIE